MNSKPPPPPPKAVTSKPPLPPLIGNPSTKPPAPVSGGSVGAPPLPVHARPVSPPVQIQAPTLPPVWQSRLRVSVKASARDPNLLVVRPLPEGQRVPPG